MALSPLFFFLAGLPLGTADSNLPPGPSSELSQPPGSQSETHPDRIAGYQAGAFSNQANAQALLKKLGDHTFFCEIHKKTVRDRQYWVVVVPASDIPFENVQQKLLDAGFPSMAVTKTEWNSLSPR
jgi:hypothetical protein